MLSLLFAPKLFNYVIMTLYSMNILWWLAHRSYADAFYWFFALGITATVTFGYQR